MKKFLILVSSVLLFASCSSEFDETIGQYEDAVDLLQSLSKKVLDGDLTKSSFNDEMNKDENRAIMEKGHDARRALEDVADLLDNDDKSDLANLELKEARLKKTIMDKFKEKHDAPAPDAAPVPEN